MRLNNSPTSHGGKTLPRRSMASIRNSSVPSSPKCLPGCARIRAANQRRKVAGASSGPGWSAQGITNGDSMLSRSKPRTASGSCRWCHMSPFRRTIHLLQRMDRGDGFDQIRSHLANEFTHQPVEFHQAEIKSIEFVLQYYGREIDETGVRLPAWKAWQLNKCSSMALARLSLMQERDGAELAGQSA